MARLKNKFQEIAKGEAALDFDPRTSDRPQLMELSISQVEPDPDQPRTELGDLEELKTSIREHGIVQPIIVSAAPTEGMFRIIAGERRFVAAQEIGLETIPCVVRTIDQHRRLEVQIIENIHRKDFTPIEEAKAYRRLMEEFSLTQRDLADRLGKSLGTINETLRILKLPDDIKADVRTSEQISRSVLLEIAKQETTEAQRSLWNRAVSGPLTVKDAREIKQTPSTLIKPPLPPITKVPIQTADATVTLVFHRQLVTPSDVVSALNEALRIAKKEAKIEQVDRGQ